MNGLGFPIVSTRGCERTAEREAVDRPRAQLDLPRVRGEVHEHEERRDPRAPSGTPTSVWTAAAVSSPFSPAIAASTSPASSRSGARKNTNAATTRDEGERRG